MFEIVVEYKNGARNYEWRNSLAAARELAKAEIVMQDVAHVSIIYPTGF